jgi:hypothetical protein
MVKFNKYNVFDTESKKKARIFYSLDNRVDEQKAVTLYAKDHSRALGEIFEEYQNHTDTMTDYFDRGKVVLFENHPLYAEARARAERSA